MQCVVDVLLPLWWRMCAAAGRRGWACKLACMFVRTLLAASEVWGRLQLFVVIDLFIAALGSCLCGWLICSARHGTTDNDATRLRVFGGVCLAACVGRLRRTSAWARAVCAFVFRSCRLVGGCLGVERVVRSLVLLASASVVSALLRRGWPRVGMWVGRWVGGWAGGNAVCSRFSFCRGGCALLPAGFGM
jgi:hypothetical protein